MFDYVYVGVELNIPKCGHHHRKDVNVVHKNTSTTAPRTTKRQCYCTRRRVVRIVACVIKCLCGIKSERRLLRYK